MIKPGIYKWSQKYASKSQKQKSKEYLLRKKRYKTLDIFSVGEVPDYDIDLYCDLFGLRDY
jgi:hypothetical protein